MKRFVLAAGLLTVASLAGGPAHADYAVVHFDDGSCKIWWDSVGNPWGIGWTKIAVGLPDHVAAEIALDNAITQRFCR
jgi:hypothetical protein